MRRRTCTIIEAPSDLGLRPTGVAEMPAALKGAGLFERLPDVREAGRIPVPAYDPRRGAGDVLNLEGVRDVASRLAEAVESELEAERFPLVLGGDCSILLGPALALRRRGRYGLFFIDGHSDFYSPEAEPNGELASMELAVVTGREPRELADLDGRAPLVREEDVVVFGFRDAEMASEYGSPDVRLTAMQVCELADIRRAGAPEAARQALRNLEREESEGFWIHLDADVLDDEVMPAVDYRMPGGLSPDELTRTLALALASPRAVGMDVTIYNPRLDDEERWAAHTLVRVLADAFAADQRPSRKS